jgi:hypothetical protein
MTTTKRRRLERRRKSLLEKLANVDEFVRGSVVLMKRRCTYPGCRKCAAGERHPTWVLTVSRHGKTQTVYLGERRLGRARRMVESYRTLRALIEEIADINLALLTDRPLATKGPSDDAKGHAP